VGPEEARAAARRAFGSVAQVEDAYRDQHRVQIVDTVARDVRYALRTLARSPTFTLAAVVTLALGIGVTSAVFSVADAVLFRPLPYPGADRVLALSAGRANAAQAGDTFLFLRDRLSAFSHLAAARSTVAGWNLVSGTGAHYVRGLSVSSGFFEALGTPPALGREFSSLEDTPNGPKAVVLSDRTWRQLFGARSDVLGRVVDLGGTPHTVVGVMPAFFRSIPPADVWTPIQLATGDNSLNYLVIGRLATTSSRGVGAGQLDAVRAEMVRTLARAGNATTARSDRVVAAAARAGRVSRAHHRPAVRRGRMRAARRMHQRRRPAAGSSAAART
jgi:hypothetical protein